MGENLIPRIAFAELEDAKTTISALTEMLDGIQQAATQMAKAGLPANASEPTKARRLAKNTAEMLVASFGEFKRLHDDSECGCGTSDADIDVAIASIQEVIGAIEDDDEMAKSLPAYKESALEQLLGMITGQGGRVARISSPGDLDELFSSLGSPTGPDDDEPRTRNAELGGDGTGMYL